MSADQNEANSAPAPAPDCLPAWWLSRPKEIRDFLESLDGVRVREIGKTAGGRAIIASEWGEREELQGRTSYSLCSAWASGDVRAFYGQHRRKRLSILFVGAAHGGEFEGTVAAINYLNIAATGRDLAGRPQPKMAENARRYRWAIIPILNVDARERVGELRSWIGDKGEYARKLGLDQWLDGTAIPYEKGKAFWPVPVNKVKGLGTHLNDTGYNLVYDFQLGGDCQPETRALMAYGREEMPDLAICAHSDGGSLALGPCASLPGHYKQRVSIMGGAVGLRCLHDGLAKSGIPMSPWSAGSVNDTGPLYQTDLIYQTCGALPLLIEFPRGTGDRPPRTHLEVLDIGLAALDELCVFGTRYGFRPYEAYEL